MNRALATFLLLVGAMAAVAFGRPRLVGTLREVRKTTDTYALPPPEKVAALSLGYGSAAADLVFTSTIISYGIHGEEKRRFDDVGRYLETAIELDPKFREPYRFADTLIIYQPVGNPTPDHVRHARRLVERGFREFPNDGDLWLDGGLFLAFIAPQWLADEGEKADFRAAGARALVHAGEVGGRNEETRWHALSAAALLSRAGEIQAAIQFLEKLYLLTDDPALKADIARKLQMLQGDAHAERAERREAAFRSLWRSDLPSSPRPRVHVLGPPWDPAACAGGRPCARTWAAWAPGRGGP